MGTNSENMDKNYPFGKKTTTGNYIEIQQDGGPPKRFVSSIENGEVSFISTPYEFGAIGDGVTDDTTAVQNAINSASSTTGLLVIPKGTFLVDTLTVPSNLTIVGQNRVLSKLKLIDNPSGPLLNCDGTTDNIKENINISNLRLEHRLGFTKDGELKGVLIRGFYTRNINIENVDFINFSMYGISLSQIDDNITEPDSITISGCRFESDKSETNSLAILLFDEAEYVKIVKNKFKECASAVLSFRSANCTFLGNTVLRCGNTTGNRYPIFIEAAVGNACKMIVANNSINHFYNIPIKVQGNGTFNFGSIIQGNNVLFSNNGALGCIDITNTVGAIVNGNRLRCPVGSNGIQIDSLSSENIVSSNIVLEGSIVDNGTSNVLNSNISGIT